MRWRHIPLALRVAIVLQLATLVVRMMMPFVTNLDLMDRLVDLSASVRYAVHVLFAVGALDLSRQLMGRARRGAQVAFVAALLDLALELLWSVMVVNLSWFQADAWSIVLDYGYLLAHLGVMAGFVMAAWGRHTMLAVAGIVVGLVTTPPSFLMLSVYQALELDIAEKSYFHLALEVPRIAMVLVLALAASTAPHTPPPALAERGFRRASRALWLRVIAVGVVPVLTLLGALGGSGDMTAVVKTATVASVVVGVVSLTQFAVGTIGVAHAQLPHLRALPLYASGVGALVCAGFAMLQTRSMFEYDRYLAERAMMWSFAAPLIAIGSLWCLRFAIIDFATHQRLLALRARASGRGGGACGLLLASLVITSWMIPGAGSVGAILFLMLVSLACSLGGTVILANLCAAAGESVRDVPALPTATAM